MSSIADDIKELKAITLQILKNQTLVIAHLVNQAQLQQPQLKTIKSEPQEQKQVYQQPRIHNRRNTESSAKPLVELNNNGGEKRRRMSTPTAAATSQKVGA